MLIDDKAEMENPSSAMKYIATVMVSEGSPLVEACAELPDEQLGKIADAAAYIAVYTINHALREAADTILEVSSRSKSPGKNATGRTVATILAGIAEEFLPPLVESDQSATIHKLDLPTEGGKL